MSRRALQQSNPLLKRFRPIPLAHSNIDVLHCTYPSTPWYASESLLTSSVAHFIGGQKAVTALVCVCVCAPAACDIIAT